MAPVTDTAPSAIAEKGGFSWRRIRASAVSNPRPKSMPSGNICHGLVIDFISRPRSRFMKPRLFSRSSSAASSKEPERISRNTFQMPTMTTRLMSAMT